MPYYASKTIAQKFLDFLKHRDELEEALERPPTSKELAKSSGWKVSDIHTINYYEGQVEEKYTPDDAYTLVDPDVDVDNIALNDSIGRGINIEKYMQNIPPLESKYLRMYFQQGMTQAQIATQEGATNQYINIVFNRGLKQLRENVRRSRLG
jgi:DNA-directed RNA polymerase specialized sigma subunit